MSSKIINIDKQKRLTPAQELFCAAVAGGKNYTDAYIDAYPNAEKWKVASATNKGHTLAKRGDIQARIAELKESLAKEVQKKFVWTKEKSIATLALIATKGEKEAVRVSAIRELNAMLGFNEPAKMDLTSTDGTMSPKPVIDAKKLPDDVLKMILEAKSEISEKQT